MYIGITVSGMLLAALLLVLLCWFLAAPKPKNTVPARYITVGAIA